MRRNKEKRFENDERETRMYGIHIIFLSTSSGIPYSYVREHARGVLGSIISMIIIFCAL
jgi:hypothetical protein